ncbi:hypothetical protein NUV25_10520 [Burkholderia pseudomultivorans]|nr:hypothetical protein [Burkholderia pseudomultivorans]MDS0858141.1 hypothetical protein [Burkholderia pseudomultivorans]
MSIKSLLAVAATCPPVGPSSMRIRQAALRCLQFTGPHPKMTIIK